MPMTNHASSALTGEDLRRAIAPIEEIIDDARNGRMFILVDQEDRENEGDLVIPAQMCTPQAINFMATHGRGLICLALTEERVDQLGLPLMAPRNESRHATAFTVSIEAREGITTGISAYDRARTVAVAIDPTKTAADLVTPGHIFPLRARKGGVLVRAGHTEAAVDIARLAGLNPSGVICEIMNDDGTMARLPDLVPFARKHGLKIGTIADLIAYRLKHEKLVREIEARGVASLYGGHWQMRLFVDQVRGAEHVALVKGDLSAPGSVLVRVHVLDVLADALGIGPDHAGHLQQAMQIVAAHSRGVVVLLRDPKLTLHRPEAGAPPLVLREYGIGAQILAALGLHEITLVTNSPLPKVVGLEAFGIRITGTHPITKE